MIVVDTNVMVYLLTGAGPAVGPAAGLGPAAGSFAASGPGAAAARLLRDDPEWVAPPILLSEVRNVVVGLVRRGSMELTDAVAICEDAEAILDDRVASVPAASTLETAIEGGLSGYDAEFVVLARRLGLTLVTADQAILDAAPDVAVGLER